MIITAYDERHFAMIGERTGNVFRIGDEITVRVVKVNKDERSIDFEIVGMKGTRRERTKLRRFLKRAAMTKKPRRNTGRAGVSRKAGGRVRRKMAARSKTAKPSEKETKVL